MQEAALNLAGTPEPPLQRHVIHPELLNVTVLRPGPRDRELYSPLPVPHSDRIVPESSREKGNVQEQPI